MSDVENKVSVDDAKQEILGAMLRGLNVTANASHIRDLAEAYCLLSTSEGGGVRARRSPGTPLVQSK